MKFVEMVTVIQAPKPALPAEDLHATGKVATTVEGIEMAAEDWLEQAAKQTKAAEGSDYVKLYRRL